MKARSSSSLQLPYIAFVWALVCYPANAHIMSFDIDDFYLGILHPITALEHIFPLLALGALAAGQGRIKGPLTTAIFLTGLAAGLAYGTVHDPDSMALPNNLNYLSFLVFGGLLALARPAPLYLFLPLAAVFGISHGYGNGAMLRGDMVPLRFCNGAFLAMVCILIIGFLPAALIQKPGFRIALRVLGSWIAAIGLMMMALEFAKN